ncbi:OmpA family protein [Geobacter sp. DSM 9736]|uniref:OmpA family protein n=1 Tax=Geobacter sp. DSM 9736 TaxID=1277350 RepID=UPI000B512BBF|nr:OmpA family protein [Geobacter sp. DSM 9736]SNB46166.1 OmpA-OmpF porin, OOP family [Geobacter sp. DSM 9736]
MKRSTGLLIGLALAISGGAQAGAAGICSDCFTFSGMVGGYSFDGEQHLETRPVVGVRGGYNFNRYLGAEVLFDYARTESTRAAGDANAFRYGGELLLHLLPDARMVPYVAAGYGATSVDYNRQPTFTDEQFSYGGGVKWFISDSMAFRGDLRHLVMREDRTFHNFEYTAGLSWQFGGAGAGVAQKPSSAERTGAGGPTTAMPSGEKPAAGTVAPPKQPMASGAPAPQARMEQPPAGEEPLQPPPSAEPAPGRYKYCISLNIESDIDRASVRPEYHDEMAKVGEFMKQYPTTTAVIEGHADDVGAAGHNLELSQRRAESVVDYLVEKFGIDRSRLTAKGLGSSRPVAENATEEDRQRNRRVEAIIDCAFDVREIKPPDRLCTQLKLEFDTGSAKVRPEGREEIARVADYMKKYPTTTAVVEGHTDNAGGHDFNMKLSRERAESVVKYLAEEFGIERSRLSAKGYGYTRRIAYNNTPEGRQKNRRINAVIDCVVRK